MPKKVQFLTVEEELDLARRWRDCRDVRARDRLIMSYRPFALRAAEQAAKLGRGNIEDLAQEATLALLEAADKFEPERGHRFSTYARFTVQQRLNKHHFDMSGPFRVGTTQADKRALYRFPKLRAEWEAAHGRELDDEGRRWIAHQAGTSMAVLRDVEAHLRGGYVALDAPAFADGDGTVQDTIADEAQGPDAALRHLLNEERTELFEWALSRLPERERKIVEMRFGVGARAGLPAEHLETIAVLEGVSRERIRQVEARAINMLRQMIASAPRRAERLAQPAPAPEVRTSRLPASLTPEDIARARARAKELSIERHRARRRHEVWARQAQMRLIDWCAEGGWVFAGSISGQEEVRAAAA
jgi:RNA polymerase sigma-32 factor